MLSTMMNVPLTTAAILNVSWAPAALVASARTSGNMHNMNRIMLTFAAAEPEPNTNSGIRRSGFSPES